MDDTQIIQDLGGKNPRVTKAYKEWKKEQEALAEGKTVLGIEDYQQCIDMITRLDDSKVLSIYLDGDYQVEFHQKLDIGGEKAIVGTTKCECLRFLTQLALHV
jgi:hypothetical protein